MVFSHTNKLTHFLLLLLATWCPLNVILPQALSFKVMSYNIRYANPKDGNNDWNHRRPLLVSLLLYHAPDIVGTQEAMRRQLDALVEDIPAYAWTGVCRTDGTTNPKPDDEFSAILYRMDRFDKLEGNTFWLSAHPDEIGSTGWDAALPRIVTWAKFRDRLTNRVFFVFNTHFDHMGAEARAQSALLLLQKLSAIAGMLPVVLLGDFNCTPADKPYTILTNEESMYHVMDTKNICALPHYGPTCSFAPNFNISGLDGRLIDHVFVRGGMEVMKHATLSDNWNGVLASDHLPVLAELYIRAD